MPSHSPKRTKVVCTIGPASAKPATLMQMVRSGMNVCRLNFSHGTHADHAKLIRLIRSVAKRSGKPLAILQDLQGPKIRTGNLPAEGVSLTTGKSVTFTTATTAYRGGKIPVTHRQLHRDLRPKHRILLDDGLMEVVVTVVRGRDILARVVNGGVLKSHKGMNLPDTVVDIPALTAKDRKDAAFGIAQDVDWIALSFVKTAADVQLLRKRIRAAGGHQKIIVKIEKHEAITNFSEILGAVDGVMVARGDLGVEIPAAEVPLRQKAIIEAARAVGKPVVVATQMLDSMIRNPRPTRAEVSDVANAVIDHADGIMLSGESATGQYPVRAVQVMDQVAREVEASQLDDVRPCLPPGTKWDPADIVAESAALLAAHLSELSGVLVATCTGATARRIARFRPQLPIFAATPDAVVERQLALSYGVTAFHVAMVQDRATFTRRALHALRAKRLIPRHGSVVLIAGEPWGEPGTANSVTVHRW